MNNEGLSFAGELLIAGMFLISGTMKLVDRAGTLALMRAHKFPLVIPSYLAALTIEFGCGACVLLGLARTWQRAEWPRPNLRLCLG